MDEMLANHYFLARNYTRAAELLEVALRGDPKNKGIRRKLIISYAQTGQVEKARDVFLSLIKEDIDFIINTDPVDDDCPCPELVFEMERGLENFRESYNYTITLGMFWLYCNLHKSYEYFNMAEDMDPQDKWIKSVLALLNARVEQEKSNLPH
jgi:pentatricopeptide repeat protein